MAPAVLAFRIQIEAVARVLHRGDLVSCPDKFRYDSFDERGLAAVRFSYETNDGSRHAVIGQSSIVIGYRVMLRDIVNDY
jgi:hypothetical protein